MGDLVEAPSTGATSRSLSALPRKEHPWRSISSSTCVKMAFLAGDPSYIVLKFSLWAGFAEPGFEGADDQSNHGPSVIMPMVFTPTLRA
jgi:hypothetical protein